MAKGCVNRMGDWHKYRAVKTRLDGKTFASKHEAAVYAELKLREMAGEIQDLKLQPRFEIIPSFKRRDKTIRKTEYVADFMFIEKGKTIVVDAKSKATEKDKAYRIKRKAFLYKYGEGVEFREVYADGKVVVY